ncbi:MAG: CARDB domain-containing protein, partial [Myxococcaceae bacterium]
MAVIAHDGTDYAIRLSGQPNDSPRSRTARAFYESHSDGYDFLVVFPTFAADLGQDVGGIHWGVRNDVSGIGMSATDLGAEFGSAARLKGYIDVGTLLPGAAPPDVQAATNVVAHEILHQWAVGVPFRDRRTGQIRTDLLGRDSSHWSFFLDSEASVEYGSDWVDNGNGTFTAKESRLRYSALDLYLMGFLAPAEVPPFSLLTPGSQVTYSATDISPPDGTTITATAESVSIDDIIAATGPRVPSSASASRLFRAAFVVLAPPGQQPTQAQLSFVEAVRKRWANEFFFLTRGRALMETEFVEVPPGAVSDHPSVGQGLDFLLAAQNADGSFGDFLPTRTRDSEVALEALAMFASDPRVSGALSRGAAYLRLASAGGVDGLARRILGLSAAREPVGALAADFERLTDPAGVNAGGGFGYAAGYSSTILDSALAGRAQLSAGVSSQALASLTSYLMSQQRTAGGWPMLAGGPAAIGPTAQVLQYLASLPRTSDTVTKAAPAIAFLRGRRQASGLYLEEVQSAVASAQALLAVASWGQLDPAETGVTTTELIRLQRPDGSWAGSVFQTAEVLKALRVALAPNLVLLEADVSLSSMVLTEGEPLVATALVRNEGFAESGPVSVRAFGQDGRPMGPAQTVQTVLAGASAPVTLVLDTTGHGGATQVFIVVDSEGLVDETREDDNRVAKPLLVRPAPAGSDFFVAAGSLQAAPSSVSRLPASITVSGRVGNLGQSGATGVTVSLLVQGNVVASAQVDLAAQSNVPITLTGTVTSATGTVPVAVVVNPGGVLAEERDDNNSAAIALPLDPTVNVGVTGLTLSPSPVDQGRDLSIVFSVRNQGTSAASTAHARATIRNSSGAIVASLPPKSVTVPAGGAVSVNMTWRANAAGQNTVEVAVDHPDDADAADNSASAPVSVVGSPLPNLLVRVGGLTVTPDPPLEGQQATASAVITNEGGGPAGAFWVELFVGDPAQGGVRFARLPVAQVLAGASQSVSAPFDANFVGERSIVVKVDSDSEVSEFDEDDNLAVIRTTPDTIPDLSVSAADISPTPDFPKEGDVVSVAVWVSNLGGQDAAQVGVELYLGAPEAGGTPLGTATLGMVGAGGREQATFGFDTAGRQGGQGLVAIVNQARAVTESRYDNNRAERQVVVQDANLALSNPYFSPNADGVKDDTALYYRLAQAAPVTVDLMDAEGTLVNRLSAPASTGGSISWDGRASDGRLARDGVYRMLASADAPGSSSLLGELSVVVDTNRSPLEDAAGTTWLTEENLEASFSSDKDYIITGSPIAAMPDDSGVVFYKGSDHYDWSLGRSVGCGFYFQPIGGGAAMRLTPDSMLCDLSTNTGIAVSPDGDRIAFVKSNCSPYSCSAQSIELFSVSTQTFSVLPIDPAMGVGGPLVFSPDGKRLVLVVGSRPVTLRAIDLAGGGGAVLATDTNGFLEYGFSPDGSKLSFMTYSGLYSANADGSGAQRLVDLTVVSGLGLSPSMRHAWISDGREIAFTIDRQSHWDCAGKEEGCQEVLNPTPVPGVLAANISTGATRMLFGTELASSLASGPGGEAVAFSVNRRNGLDLGIWFSGTRNPMGRLFVNPGDYVTEVRWSPLGTFIHALVRKAGTNTERYLAYSSLGNLGTRLAASRAAGSSGFAFLGTATDHHFEDYELAVRPLASSGAPLVLGRSPLSVVNGLLGQWAPGAPGIYEATLTARDKAGNSRTRKTKLAWSHAPAVANVTRSPAVFSPNGDGVLDSSTVSYTVTAPISAELSFVNAGGIPVRRILKTHLQAESASLAWDGLDDQGVTVVDGAYSARVEGVSVPVEVDNTPPVVSLELKESTPFGGSHEFVAIEIPVLLGGLADTLTSVGIPRSWAASDVHLTGWSVESSSASAPGVFGGGWFGSTAQEKDVLWVGHYAGGAFRLRATDAAGNEAVTAAKVPSEKLFITGVGYPKIPGAMIVAGDALPFLEPLELTRSTGEPGRVALLPKPGASMGFILANSVGSKLVSFELARRDTSSGAFTVVPNNVSAIGESYLEMQDGQSGEYEVRASDATGRVFTAQVEVRIPLPGPPSVCVGAGWPEAVGVIPDYDLGANEFLAPGATVEFLPSGSNVVEKSFPLANFSFDTSALTRCEYAVRARGATTSGRLLLTPEAAVNLCDTRLLSATADGAEAVLRLAETHRAAVSSVDVYFQDPAQVPGWTPAGTLAGFEGLAPEFRFGLDASLACRSLALRLVTHLADGTVVDEVLEPTPPGSSCPSGPSGLSVPCLHLAVTAVRDGPSASCAPHTAAYAVSISGGGAPVAALSASAKPLAGPAVPFSLSGFVPDAGTVAATASFDTSLFPEGVYTVSATAVDALGVTASATADRPIIVDRTPPYAVVSSPASAVLVCPSQVPAPDGTQSRRFDVLGAVGDLNLESYSVLLRPPQGQLVPVFTKSYGAPTPVFFSGALATVDVTGQPSGQYEVALEARDVSGGSVCTTSVSFQLGQGVQVLAARAAPELFSPDADGVLDLTEVAFTLDQGAEVTAHIESATASFGTAFQGSFPAGDASVVWPGALQGGAPLPAGDYTVRLVAVDPCGLSAETSAAVSVDVTAPVARIDDPAAGASAGAVVTVTGEATDTHFDSYLLELGAGLVPTAFSLLHQAAAPAQGVLGAVSTANLAPGSYTIRLTVTDTVGHVSVATRSIEVDARQLVESLVVAPSVVSPNGDGNQDTAQAVIGLRAGATVTVHVVATGGAVAATAFGPTAAGAGTLTVPLEAAVLGGLADGAYGVRLTASAGGPVETAEAPLTLDRMAPDLAITAPVDNGFTGPSVEVTGGATDEHPSGWTLAHVAPGAGAVTVGSGSGSFSGRLAALSSLAEGPHQLELRANDTAGNQAARTSSFTVDATPPVVAFATPLSGAWLSGRSGPTAVVASLTEAHLESVELQVILGSAAPRTLFQGASLPASGLVAAWDVAAEPDGPASLVLVAEDLAGNQARSTISVELDSTLPVAHLDSPRGQLLTSGSFVGTASDANLSSWTLSLSDGAPASASRFVQLASGTGPIASGALAAIASLPADGEYTAELVVVDRAGNTATDTAGFTVDTSPPLPALDLTAQVLSPDDVELTWSASPSADVVGYRVLRAAGAGVLGVVSSGLVTATVWLDPNVPDGTYRYVVVAVDGGGLASAGSK